VAATLKTFKILAYGAPDDVGAKTLRFVRLYTPLSTWSHFRQLRQLKVPQNAIIPPDDHTADPSLTMPVSIKTLGIIFSSLDPRLVKFFHNLRNSRHHLSQLRVVEVFSARLWREYDNQDFDAFMRDTADVRRSLQLAGLQALVWEDESVSF
jgi:hypothetical protein